MKRIKIIRIRIGLEAEGLLSAEGTSPPQVISSKRDREDVEQLMVVNEHGNNSYPKANYLRDSNGDVRAIPKFSTAKLLTNAIQPLDVAQVKWGLTKAIASPEAFIRGYLVTEKGSNSLVRGGCLKLTHPKIEGKTIFAMETSTRRGERDNTSIFNKPYVGECTYSSDGYLDIHALSFISLDDSMERKCFDESDIEEFCNEFNKYDFPDKISPKDVCYYKKKDDKSDTRERGILLSNANIAYLVKLAFEKLLMIQVSKGLDAHACVSDLEVCLVEAGQEEPAIYYKRNWDSLCEKLIGEDGRKNHAFFSSIDKLVFETEYERCQPSDFKAEKSYNEKNLNDLLELRTSLEKQLKDLEQKNSDDKSVDKLIKKTKRDIKINKDRIRDVEKKLDNIREFESRYENE